MKQDQTNKQPLYKVLNEKRTQGNWEYNGITKIVCGDKVIYQDLKTFAPNVPEDAQYTALAVNNLAHLAEALETIQSVLQSWDNATGAGKYRNLIFHIETALNRIS